MAEDPLKLKPLSDLGIETDIVIDPDVVQYQSQGLPTAPPGDIGTHQGAVPPDIPKFKWPKWLRGQK
jgi:hypothetical protein